MPVGTQYTHGGPNYRMQRLSAPGKSKQDICVYEVEHSGMIPVNALAGERFIGERGRTWLGILFKIIQDYYPDLETEDIRACIQYAIDVAAVEDVRLAPTRRRPAYAYTFIHLSPSRR